MCSKPLDVLTFTSAWEPFKKHLAAITHEYDIAVERIWYAMAGIAWSMVWAGRHGKVYGMVHGMAYGIP